jgi:hypothetical protein
MQDRPVCFQCTEPIKTNSEMIFEAPCGHGDCRSAVFHALCLFEWRERAAKFADWLNEMREKWLSEHSEHMEKFHPEEIEEKS